MSGSASSTLSRSTRRTSRHSLGSYGSRLPRAACRLAGSCQDLGRVGHGLRRNVERDALTVKGDLPKRISLSMTQPGPRLSSYIAMRLAPTRWAFGLRSASRQVLGLRGFTHRKRQKAKRLAPFCETASPIRNRRRSADAPKHSDSPKPAEEILVGNGRRLRVVAVVPFDEEDESPFVELLQVEAA